MSLSGVLDRLPPFWRDLIVAVLPGVLGFASSQIPALQDRSPAAAYALGILITVLGTVLTPATRSYGLTRWSSSSTSAGPR